MCFSLRVVLQIACAISLPVCCVGYEQQHPAQTVDVAVIGAGLAGLSAARTLKKSGKSVLVLEARDRVGGRVFDVPLRDGMGVTETGAEFVGPTQDRVLQLIAELGLETFNTYDTGNTTLFTNGQRQTFQGPFPTDIDPVSITEALAVMEKLDQMAATIDTNAPWKHPDAADWDKETFYSWMRRQTSNHEAQFIITLAILEFASSETWELSLLYVIAYVTAAGNEVLKGNLQRLISVQGGAQEKRVKGGMQQLAKRLAEFLSPESLSLNSVVGRVAKDQSDDMYTITGEGRLKLVRANHVVIAMSPPLAARITYDPPLPAERDQLTQRMPMSSIGKAIAIYNTPFWRAHDLNGQVWSDTGAVRYTIDCSPEDGSYGALMGFIQANEMRRLDEASAGDIIAEVTGDYVRYFGPQAADTIDFVIQRWDREEFSRGGPTAIAPPGVLTEYGPALKSATGNIHFAGTESSPYWTGYVDGAIRSGERAAGEIL